MTHMVSLLLCLHIPVVLVHNDFAEVLGILLPHPSINENRIQSNLLAPFDLWLWADF